LGTPVLIALIERHRLPPLPYLLALATGANTGSVATVVGNPQNMLCANLGNITYLEHLAYLGPVALIGLVINHALLSRLFRKQLASATIDATRVPRSSPVRSSLDVFVVLGAMVVLFALGADLAFTAVGGCGLLLVWRRQLAATVLREIDAAVLLFFAGLFIVVEALVRTGLPDAFFTHVPLGDGDGIAGLTRLSALFLFGSNVVSNVPFIVVAKAHVAALPDPRVGWLTLAMASTFAGNLTLLGSVANIIVAERARAIGGIGFLEYLRIGLPLALLTTGVGALWLFLVAS
jgi:Na+/H+ antiporter NhaD/arsenite permease-like protein